MRLLAMTLSTLLLAPVWADTALPVFKPQLVLDKVDFNLSTREWVNTSTALLSVHISATLSNTDMVKARNSIMQNLVKIAPGDWQLTQFERSQDSSGLEKLEVDAQARVSQAALSSVYTHAKNVSHPGESYFINGIDFKPSLEEMQDAKARLRDKLYQKVQDEIARLNKIYNQQQFSVHRIWFFEGDIPPMAKRYQQASDNMVMLAQSAPSIVVSNEVKMSVLAELASNRAGS